MLLSALQVFPVQETSGEHLFQLTKTWSEASDESPQNISTNVVNLPHSIPENTVERSQDTVQSVAEPPRNAIEFAVVEDGGTSSSDEVCS